MCFVEKGVIMFILCFLKATESRTPDTQDLPQKGSLPGTLASKDPFPAKHLILRCLIGIGTHFLNLYRSEGDILQFSKIAIFGPKFLIRPNRLAELRTFGRFWSCCYLKIILNYYTSQELAASIVV